MNIQFTRQAWEDYLYFQSTDKTLLRKINQLLKHTSRDPFNGPGKPEPLKFELSGCWSRRIDREHRLVYRVDGETLQILACRYHYG